MYGHRRDCKAIDCPGIGRTGMGGAAIGCPGIDATEPRAAFRLAPVNFSGLRLRLPTDRIIPSDPAVLRGAVPFPARTLTPVSDGSEAWT